MKMGEILLKAGIIDRHTLGEALEVQRVQKRRLGQILVDMGATDYVVIAKALARQLKIPYGRLHNLKIAKEVLELVSPKLAENYLVVPVKTKENSLLVAMADPLDLNALNDLRFFTQLDIQVAVSPQGDILDAIERNYPQLDLKRNLKSALEANGDIEIIPVDRKEKNEDIKETQEILSLIEQAPIVRFLNSTLADAIKQRASDVHIEPDKLFILVRYRVDGTLREVMRADKSIHAAVVSRIKIMSNLDITIKRKPQDGKAQLRYGYKTYDLRVSTLPTSYGEKVTIRILDPAKAALNPEDLGFSDKDLKNVLQAIHRPQGIILVTGPTGSGKSSTLYACLNKLKSPEINIMTVEDPVEFDVAGINQVQINPAAGITFAAGLRSILRQDPDVIMVGEIRDTETAVTAVQAAQTGHLVLSTLHTNDALSAVIRLMDLGIDPFLVSEALIAVVGQRLVRKTCPYCKTPETVSHEQMEAIRPYISKGKLATFWKGIGCEQCKFTGYSGRMGVFEVLMITPSIRKSISSHFSSADFKEEAQSQGFQTMTMDGISKAIEGLTTIDEVFRVAPPETMGHVIGPAGETDAHGDDDSEKGYAVEPMPILTSAEPKRILIVDQNKSVRKLLSAELEAEGYIVATAEDGLQALQLIFNDKPNLIISALLIPKIDGLTLIKELKSQLNTRFIPIIILTKKDEMESEVEVIEAGADDYLVRPVAPKRFLARVKRLLNK
jgi:type IV pilus assembly protein PilB